MICRRIFFIFFLIAAALHGYAYKIITPEPFSIASKNYLKLQILAEKNDPVPDSVFFDILYNTGSTLTHRVDASLSYVLTLNEFNDGVFSVKARVYHNGNCDTLGSKYDASGIPVILDRHPSFNETQFTSLYLSESSKKFSTAASDSVYEFAFNNNKVRFSSLWDSDSLYFSFHIKDAHLNYREPGYIDLFQAKHFLKTLWNSDCIEIGLDLQHDRAVWKGKDDYEFLVDVKGNFIGNRWSTADSLYTNWGDHTKVMVERTGTLNNNQDTDDGYNIYISIPWTELNFVPKANQSIGFDIQLYDKDAELDEAFRTSISGTNPESNDNTSEWTSLLLKKDVSSFSYLYLLLLIPVIGLALYAGYKRTRKNQEAKPAVYPEKSELINQHPSVYSDSIQNAINYIAEQYHEPELSRQQIAEHVFISEKYLSSLFKKETGINLMTYINQFRIEKSIQLLQETRLPISEIAFKVGYNSLQNFNKNFRSITQNSPSHYRKAQS